MIKNKTQCLEMIDRGNKWVNHKYNFDNLGQALMSLFVLSSKDGWVSIMYQGLDAVGPDQQVRYMRSFINVGTQIYLTTLPLFHAHLHYVLVLQKDHTSPPSMAKKQFLKLENV